MSLANLLKEKRQISGLLFLDKPCHVTSNVALQMVKHLYKAQKAGHTGSLDPLATGILPICLGEETKYANLLLESDKIYETTIHLGVKTNTGDKEGYPVQQRPISHISDTLIEQLLLNFQGYITQIAPKYSALKYKGRPLYYYARKGIDTPLKSRQIHIKKLELLRKTQDTLSLRVHCSHGTYIRTLANDIGEYLTCGAHVETLRRIAIGPFYIQDTYTIKYLQTYASNNLDQLLKPLGHIAYHMLPKIDLNEWQCMQIQQGLTVETLKKDFFPGNIYAIRYKKTGYFMGVGVVTSDKKLKAKRLVSLSES